MVNNVATATEVAPIAWCIVARSAAEKSAAKIYSPAVYPVLAIRSEHHLPPANAQTRKRGHRQCEPEKGRNIGRKLQGLNNHLRNIQQTTAEQQDN